MTSLVDLLQGIASGAQSGAFPKGRFSADNSLYNLMYGPDWQGVMAAQAGQQQPQQQAPMMPMQRPGQPGGNSLAAYMRGNLPLTRMMFG